MLDPKDAESNKLSADQFKPINPAKDPGQRSDQIDTMAHRIVGTYLQSSKGDRDLGEHFYSRDAHGAARALSLGVNPNSSVGNMMRKTPSPGEQQSEWRGGKSISQPSTVSTGSPQNAAIKSGVRRAAGTLARLSPQTDWNQNIERAHQAYHMPEEQVQDLMHDKRSSLKGTPLNSSPSDTIIHAQGIASGKVDPDKDVATGAKRVKIGSFMNNIADPDTSPNTTVDFRAHDISAGKLLRTSTNRGLSSKGRYDMFEEAHNRATDILNTKHPTERNQSAPLQPKQVQATTWWTDKHFVDNQLGGGGSGSGSHLHMKVNGKSLSRDHLGKPAGQ